jgi:hypothetical protein
LPDRHRYSKPEYLRLDSLRQARTVRHTGATEPQLPVSDLLAFLLFCIVPSTGDHCAGLTQFKQNIGIYTLVIRFLIFSTNSAKPRSRHSLASHRVLTGIVQIISRLKGSQSTSLTTWYRVAASGNLSQHAGNRHAPNSQPGGLVCDVSS